MQKFLLRLAAFALGLGVALPHAHAVQIQFLDADGNVHTVVSTAHSGGALPVSCPDGSTTCFAGGGGSVPTTGKTNADAIASVGTGYVPGASFLFGYNGTTWDRLRTDTTSGLWVQVKASALPTGAALDATLSTINTSLGTINTTLGTPMKQTGGTVQPVPGTANGCTPYHLAGGTGASTNSTSMKGSAGNLCDLLPINTTTTVYYLKIYDSAGAPTCSSATGIKHVFPIPPAASAGLAGGFARQMPLGESYANGIGFCVTASGADTSSDNAATGVYIEASYK